MGTNFYFFTKDKDLKDSLFNYDEWEFTEEPELGYLIHLAKTSYGWKPLFQSNKSIKKVADIKPVFDKGGFSIVDEYGNEYDWPHFKRRVINFNKHNPEAISHPEYNNREHRELYYIDEDGFEFTNTWFR